jgi:hypothetical protein
MRKLFFAFVLWTNVLCLYAAAQTQVYPEITLKIVNMTDEKVKFFLTDCIATLNWHICKTGKL